MHCHKNISGRKSAPFEFSGQRDFFPVRRKYPVHGQGKACFTLIELLVVIAIMAILSRSKNSFFLLFSAI